MQYWTSILVNIAPFGLLIALWFLMNKRFQNWSRASQLNTFGQPQQTAPANVAAELRALRESIDALRKELADRR